MPTATGEEQFFDDDIDPHKEYKPAKSFLELIGRNFLAHGISNENTHDGQSGNGQ